MRSWLLEHITVTLAHFLDQVRGALEDPTGHPPTHRSLTQQRQSDGRPRLLIQMHSHGTKSLRMPRDINRVPSGAHAGDTGHGAQGARAPMLETRLQVTNRQVVFFPSILPLGRGSGKQVAQRSARRLAQREVLGTSSPPPRESTLGVSMESYAAGEASTLLMPYRGSSLLSDVSVCGSVQVNSASEGSDPLVCFPPVGHFSA